MSDLARLAAHLDGLGRVLLGYSGGADSTLLAVVGANRLGRDRFLAVLGQSASLASHLRRSARELAARFHVPFLELPTREFEDPRYVSNPTNRCYFCKAELWTRLTQVARECGFDVVVDGTNADDLSQHRPGLRAAQEFGVESPLADLGWRKSDIRAALRHLGVPVWNAPAAPCLSSRIRYGLAVTPDRLRQVEEGEAFLRSLGLEGDLRVRHLGDTARLEIDPAYFELLEQKWSEVARTFARLGFQTVELDPRGYRRGALLAVMESR
jgi:pyridinium-3,5-biscarboxylic acid mononucleotide sulfurtransferase